MEQRSKSKILVKASYKAGLGHQAHISGCGRHDNRPKRQRTRQAANKKAINEYG